MAPVAHGRTGTTAVKIPKPEPQSKVRARKKRQDQQAVKTAHEVVFEEDRACRFPERGRDLFPCGPRGANDQLAHLDDRKRSRTRGRSPEFRHDPEHMMRLCPNHHGDYDGPARRREERFTIQYLTDRKARGPCRFLQHGTGLWLGDN